MTSKPAQLCSAILSIKYVDRLIIVFRGTRSQNFTSHSPFVGKLIEDVLYQIKGINWYRGSPRTQDMESQVEETGQREFLGILWREVLEWQRYSSLKIHGPRFVRQTEASKRNGFSIKRIMKEKVKWQKEEEVEEKKYIIRQNSTCTVPMKIYLIKWVTSLMQWLEQANKTRCEEWCTRIKSSFTLAGSW